MYYMTTANKLMQKTKSKTSIALFAGISALFMSQPAIAAVDGESVYIFNTLLFLIGGFLVMWMAAGFTMLEAGLVRSKNVGDICVKNISLFALACIMFLFSGYQLMYAGVDGGFLGTFSFWGADDTAALADSPDFAAGYAASSDFFFQMVFVATTASIVSGTVAERIRLFPFLIFTAILAGVLYPIQGAWNWAG
jgi:Amt family ammonium transporter